MPDDFRALARDLAPRGWLRDDTSQAWLTGLGGAVSASLVLLRNSVKVRFASTAPEDALVHIGDTRQIERAPRETATNYRTRLRRCFDIHAARTTADAYREALLPLGVDGADVAVWSDWQDSIMPADPGTPAWWSRVTVVVDATVGPWTAPIWEDGAVWSESEVWGIGGMTPAEVAWLRRTIRKWKWAGAYPLAVVIIFGGDAWGLETVWSASAVWSDDPASVAVLPLGMAWGFNETVYGAPPDLWSDDAVWQDPFFSEDV